MIPSQARKLLALVLALILVAVSLAPVAAQIETEEAFFNTWARTDLLVAEHDLDRTWMWGPEPITEILLEPYTEHPNGMREVEYHEKSRMEVNNPNAPYDGLWYVTNGLLVVELMTGMMQVGDFEFVEREPANVHIAGDPDQPDTPTYAAYGGLMDTPAFPQGSVITATVDAQGNVGNNADLAAFGVIAAELAPETGHRTASVFWEFMNSTGPIWDWETGEFTEGRLFENPYYATGLPVTEAYWAFIFVGGTQQWVLTQAFERRVLTYTPLSDPGWRVEAGNVGLHYYEWRYLTPPPPPPPPPPPADTGIEKFVIVEGSVTAENPDGTPIAGIDVRISATAGDPAVVGDVVFDEQTDADGRIFAELTAGTYYLCLYSMDGTATVDGDEVIPALPTAPDEENCEFLTVVQGEVTTETNAVALVDPLATGIEKFVIVEGSANGMNDDGTPVIWVDIQISTGVVVPPGAADVVFTGQTDADGRIFAPLAAGDYNLCMYSSAQVVMVDGVAMSPDLPGSPDAAFCEQVTVENNEVTSLVNEVAVEEPVDTGIEKVVYVAGADPVNGSDGVPIEGVDVAISVVGFVVFEGQTDDEGGVLAYLPAGNYQLCIYSTTGHITVDGYTLIPGVTASPHEDFCETVTVVDGEITPVVNEIDVFGQMDIGWDLPLVGPEDVHPDEQTTYCLFEVVENNNNENDNPFACVNVPAEALEFGGGIFFANVPAGEYYIGWSTNNEDFETTNPVTYNPLHDASFDDTVVDIEAEVTGPGGGYGIIIEGQSFDFVFTLDNGDVVLQPTYMLMV